MFSDDAISDINTGLWLGLQIENHRCELTPGKGIYRERFWTTYIVSDILENYGIMLNPSNKKKVM